MRKIVQIIIIIGLIFAVSAVSAAAAVSASLAGPSVIRAGNTLTISVRMSGTGLQAVQGNITYDTAQLTYQSTSSTLSGWGFDFSSEAGKLTFLGVDDKLSAPIDSTKTLFKVSFKVNGSIAAGTAIHVTASNLSASDGFSDFSPSNATYSVNVAAPLSNNANLKSLTVSDGTLTPAFSKTTASYSLSVPFEVEKVTVNAAAEETGAKVKVDSPALTAGEDTTVSVTVTAPAGNTKTYNIVVSRAQDPNYVPSEINALTDLSVDAARISPAFNKDTDEYVVYLPYEVDSVTVTAAPEDEKAEVVVEGGTNLAVGSGNAVKVICTAENGSVKTYTITVVRADVFNGTVETTVTTTTTEATTTTAATTTTQQTTTTLQPTETTAGPSGSTGGSIPSGILILIIVLALAIGCETGYIVYLLRKR